jgi:hypothetical protein
VHGKDYTFWPRPKETGQRDRRATVGARFNIAAQEQLFGEQQQAFPLNKIPGLPAGHISIPGG